MGAGANSGSTNKNKALNDRKRRAAGRIKDTGPEVEAIKDFQSEGRAKPARGRAGGASGSRRNEKTSPFTTGGGGATPSDKTIKTGASKKPARRRTTPGR